MSYYQRTNYFGILYTFYWDEWPFQKCAAAGLVLFSREIMQTSADTKAESIMYVKRGTQITIELWAHSHVRHLRWLDYMIWKYLRTALALPLVLFGIVVIYIEPFLFFLFLTYLMASSLHFEFYCVEINPVDLLCQMFYECKFD